VKFIHKESTLDESWMAMDEYNPYMDKMDVRIWASSINDKQNYLNCHMKYFINFLKIHNIWIMTYFGVGC
jgi:hypothetical protein